MTLFHAFDVVTNKRGDSLPGYLVRLTTVAGAPVAIYGDENGTPIAVTSGLANTAVTDDAGNYSLFVDYGTYNIEVRDPAGTLQTTRRAVPMLVGAPGPAGPQGVPGIPGGNVMSVGPASSLSGLAIPTGTNLIQTSDATRGQWINDSSLTDADVAAHPLAIVKTANGRYFRRDPNFLTWPMFGAGGGYPHDDGPALDAALAYLRKYGVIRGGVFAGTQSLYAPIVPGNYYLASPRSIKQALEFFGDGGGKNGARGTTIVCETSGLVFDRPDTVMGAPAVTTTGSDGFVLRGISFVPRVIAAVKSESAAFGVLVKSRGTIKECQFDGFAGVGCKVIASAGNPAVRGNANSFTVRNNFFNANFHGLLLDGDDANGGETSGNDYSNNASCGLWDRSTLGNEHRGGHTAGNGGGTGGAAVMCSYGGNRYAAKFGADALWATTVPGTNPNVWGFFEAGGPLSPPLSSGIPPWISGNGQVWMFGACYASTNENARACDFVPYMEGTQAPGQINSPSASVGGLFTNIGTGVSVNFEQGALRVLLAIFGELRANAIGVEGPNVPTMRFKTMPDGTVRVDFGNSDSFWPLDIWGPGTSDPNRVVIRNRLAFTAGALPNYASDAAAAAGGVPLFATYRNGSQLMVRTV